MTLLINGKTDFNDRKIIKGKSEIDLIKYERILVGK
jgi:hypothetical protein